MRAPEAMVTVPAAVSTVLTNPPTPPVLPVRLFGLLALRDSGLLHSDDRGCR